MISGHYVEAEISDMNTVMAKTPLSGGNSLVLLISHFAEEIQLIKDHCLLENTFKWNHLRIFKGDFEGCRAIFCHLDADPLFTAVTTQFLIDRFSPSAAMYAGIAQILVPFIDPGDLIVAGAFLAPSNREKSDETWEIYEADESFLTSLRRGRDILDKNGPQAVIGTVTGRHFASDNKLLAGTEQGAMACDPRGAALARTCYANSIPYAALDIGYRDGRLNETKGDENLISVAARVIFDLNCRILAGLGGRIIYQKS